jgi:hypothetical protein
MNGVAVLVILIFGESGAIRVVCKLAPTVFRPLVIEGLDFKNYQL